MVPDTYLKAPRGCRSSSPFEQHSSLYSGEIFPGGAACTVPKSLLYQLKMHQLALRNCFSFWRQPWTGHLESCLVIQIHVPVLLAHVSWQMHQNSLQYFRHSTVSSMHWTWKRGSRAGSQGINVFMTLDQGSFKPGLACLFNVLAYIAHRGLLFSLKALVERNVPLPMRKSCTSSDFWVTGKVLLHIYCFLISTLLVYGSLVQEFLLFSF